MAFTSSLTQNGTTDLRADCGEWQYGAQYDVRRKPGQRLPGVGDTDLGSCHFISQP